MSNTNSQVDYLGQIIKDIKGELGQQILKKFSRLHKTEDRFQFVWNLSSVHKILNAKTCRRDKNSELAESARKSGNSFFQKKKYKAAIAEYNKSIINAPASKEDECEQLTLSLANRSAALYHLKQYRLCIEDIDYALEMGYPEKLHYKLFDRFGKCYYDLKERSNACGYFKKALECLAVSDLNNKGRELWTNSIKKQLKAAESLQGKDNESGIRRMSKPSPPGIDIPRNPQYPCASKAMKVQYGEGRGRYVTANEDIKVGDVLLVEKAYSSVLICDFLESHCNNCLARIAVPYPCQKCTTVRYCSSACQHTAWEKYHYAECALMGWLTEQWMGQMNHLALRTILVTGFNKISKTYKQNEEHSEVDGRASPKGTFTVDYERVWSLVDHIEDHTNEELFQLTVVAVLTVKLLQLTDFWPDEKNDIMESSQTDVLEMGCSVLKLLCISQCNAFNIAEIQMTDDVKLSKPRDIGTGFYPTSALMNHSCSPNIDCNYFGDVSVYRAIQDIRAGEEINVDYGYIFYTDTYADRQFKLSQQYYFKCQCIACTEGWPLVAELNGSRPMFLCRTCSEKLDAPSLGSPTMCDKCGASCDVKSYLQDLQKSHGTFAIALEQAMNGGHHEALPVLRKHLSLVQSCIANPWRDFYSCQATIKQSYRIMGNTSTDNTF